jgi:hypothetical protein
LEQSGLIALDATVAFVGRSVQRTEVKRVVAMSARKKGGDVAQCNRLLQVVAMSARKKASAM